MFSKKDSDYQTYLTKIRRIGLTPSDLSTSYMAFNPILPYQLDFEP